MYLHAATLQENGLLPDFELDSLKDLKPEEQVLKIQESISSSVEESKKEGIKAEVDSLIEPARKFYEDLKAGVPFESLRENATLEAQYGEISVKQLEDNGELQEAIYADSLYMKGLSDTKVKQFVQISKDNETLLTDSTDGLKEIKTEIESDRVKMRQDADLAKTAREDKNKEMQGKISTTVLATKAIIPGIELKKAEQEALIKDMTVPVKFVKNAKGQQVPVSKVMELRAKDPVAFEMRLNYFIRKGFFDKDAKFENLSKEATTTATKKLIEAINDNKPPDGTPAADLVKDKKATETFVFPFPTQ